MSNAATGRFAPCQLGRMVLRFFVFLIATFVYSQVACAQLSMLHASGRNIVNANGQTVVLKGMNLGGYMVMEPWMCPADAGGLPDTYSIIQELDSRFGVAEEQTLIRDYQQAWITTQDFVNIKNAGFNVVRVPVWWGNFYPIANVSNASWRTDAFTQLDWIVNQAAAQGIYVIIDMHGVVGGQSTSDDTGQQNVNAYWTNSNDQGNTAYMWWEIANHYNGNATVAGYDLLNEPMNAPSDSAVISAYVSLYNSVRSADPTHMIFIETCFDQWDWAMLPNPSSEGWTNVVYEQHEYEWNATQAVVESGSANQVTQFNNYASYNVPDYIGEWNDMGYSAATYQYSFDEYTNNGISSTMWALKNDSPGSGWGMYTPTGTPPIPNVSTDSAATIAADWGQWTTANAFALNTGLGFSVGSGVEGPYGGTPAAIPGTVMAENYDTGGQGTGYSVSSTNGSANSYRSDGVDLEAASSPASGDDLGWTAAGQWFRYTVKVATAGTYTVSFLVAAPSAVTDAFHISNSSGTNLSGSVNIPATGGYQTWTTVTATVTLPAGTQTLTFNQDNGGWNIDSAAFAAAAPAEGPYGGTPAAIPGTVLAENYDTGGQGVAYNVTSTNGSDNAYRTDGVDLETATSPATGNDLGWTASGQWFKYTVNVATAGSYSVSFLVASPSAVTDAFHISNSAATNLSGSVNIPATGGYQTWTTVTATVTLPAGVQTLTFNQDNGGWNIDSAAFTSSGGGLTLATGTPYNIVNQNSGSCIMANGSATANGTTVVQYACAGGANSTETSQQWEFTNGTASGYFEVTNVNAPTEAWNVTSNGTASGSLIQTWTYAGASNEEWEAVSLGSGYYKFVGQGSGLCLDVPSASTANGVQLQIYTCNGTAAQAFKLVTP
ncbi:MAG: carbohydrate-binding protein [Terracidiphilus sp.]